MNAARYGATNLVGVCAVLLAAIAMPVMAQQPEAGPTNDHVAPPPPSQPMPAMSEQEMDRVMDMHDDPLLAMLKVDQFERAKGDDWSTSWEAEAWIGHDFNKLWLRSEGERENGSTDARIEAFWDHAFASFWDWQLGVRRDIGSGPGRPLPAIRGLRGTWSPARRPLLAIDGLRGAWAPARRSWAAFGVQGLAPYWFEIEATAYLGEQGRTALRVRAQYELLLTQRLILQPEFEVNVYGRRDAARDVDAGVNDASLGLRLRYEIRREIAPYIGVAWDHRFGELGFTPRHSASDAQLVAGLRVWF